MSRSSKIIIPITIVAFIALGAIAIISNTATTQEQADEIEQTNVSEIEESIQEISNISESTSSKLESNQNPSQLRAAIIDQLHDDIPNFEFQDNATRMLKDAGYQVDLYTTDEITVEFYKNLPSMNYHFIMIRSHGGEDLSYEYPTRLFTGEKYSKEKHTGEQIYGQVGYGFPFYGEAFEELKDSDQDILDQAYFTVGKKMVKEGMVGTFPDSIIIVGGCQSARTPDLMHALMDRGASHVLGWDATIGSNDNDIAMISLLEDILVRQGSLYDAVEKINNELRQDFKYNSRLQLFNAV